MKHVKKLSPQEITSPEPQVTASTSTVPIKKGQITENSYSLAEDPGMISSYFPPDFVQKE